MLKVKAPVGKGVALCLLLGTLLVAQATANEKRYLTGNKADVKLTLAGPAHVFGGGSTDVTPALQWMIDQVRGCSDCATKLDVVVLRSSGADGYNALISALNGVDSVETLVITDRTDSNAVGVKETVRNAEVIFFAGGDQCNYVRYFKGTEIEKGVERVYKRGGGVGGTSAGLAIQGDFSFDACVDTVRSAQALRNPYHPLISFTDDFFEWNNMQATITDTHFAQRDRMGRLMAFIARQIKDGKSKRVLGIAVNEKTSVVVDRNGLARVMGVGPAYFVLGDHKPEVCEPGTPLTFSNFKIWRVPSDGTFNLKQRPMNGYYVVSVVDGKIASNPY